MIVGEADWLDERLADWLDERFAVTSVSWASCTQCMKVFRDAVKPPPTIKIPSAGISGAGLYARSA